MRFFENANYPWIENRKIFYFLSGSLVFISIMGILIRGLQYGIDFTGGQEFIVQFAEPATVTTARNALTKPLGAQPVVKLYGSSTTIMIRTSASGTLESIESTIETTLTKTFPNNKATIEKTYVVGPRFANDLKLAALYSILSSIVAIFLYILIRFRKWTYSSGAIAALIHDVTITLGFFTIFDKVLPFSMSIDESLIAAFLTIVGYSINDTVVVFDRIRENLNIYKTEPFEQTVTKSINETLSRTIITSGTTLFVVVVLFIFGGQVLKGFSLALLIGIVVGTYSSIGVASALMVDLQKKFVFKKRK